MPSSQSNEALIISLASRTRLRSCLASSRKHWKNSSSCEEAEELREKTEQLERRLEMAEARPSLIFKSKPMQEIDELINAMAPSDANALIVGESGVGKEVIANAIHARSRRAEKPMVKLNCAAFPQTMIEGELFGYVKGAFTGAMQDFPGMIAAADSGTLFLDEISDMPAELQTRFLRVLQEREYRPLGSTQTMKADFRAIASTNRPIPAGARGKPAALRFVLPAKHVPNRSAAASKTETGYPTADRRVRETVCSATRQTRARHLARGFSKIAGLLVAGKCSRTAKRDRIRRGTGETRHDWRERAANGNTVASRSATNRDSRVTAFGRTKPRRRRTNRHHSGACRMPRQQKEGSGTSRHPAPHAL